jgi:hypothetical protein
MLTAPTKIADSPPPEVAVDLRYSRIFTVSLYAVLICACAVLAYYWEFQGFSGWDDEGYLMMTIKQFLQGHKLFDEVYTQYGPFYYAFKWLIFRLTGAPVTNDSVRFIAVGIWLLYPCFCSWAILRVCKSLSMAALCFAMVSVATSRVLRWEPGHPNDLSGLLLTALVFAASFLAQRPTLALSMIGVICMAAILVKLNVGVYLILGLIAGLLPFTKAFPLRRILYGIFAISALAFPTLLMRAHWSDSWAISFDVVVTLSLASAFLITSRIPVQPYVTLRAWIAAAAGGLLFGAAILGAFIAAGSTLHAIAYCSVLQHIGTDRAWYIAVTEALSWHCALVTLAGLGLMLWVSRDPIHRASSKVVISLKLILWFLLLALILLNTGQNSLATGQIAAVDAPALAWLALLTPSVNTSAGNRAFRYVLVFATLFMLLFPYPVGGDHADMPTISMIVVYVLCLHDALVMLQAKYRDVFARRRWTRAIGPAFISFSCLILLGLAGYNYHHYHSWKALDLPGATRVHLKPDEVDVMQTLVRKVNADCSGFIGMPGFVSLDFWTGQEPPTTINMSNWLTVLAPQYQYKIIHAIEGNKRACVIENDYWVEWWRRGQDLDKIPLAAYIRNNFRPYDQVEKYQILVRRDR